jgi:hypothetical protein
MSWPRTAGQGSPVEGWLCLPSLSPKELTAWWSSIPQTLPMVPCKVTYGVLWLPLGPCKCAFEVWINVVALTWVSEWSLKLHCLYPKSTLGHIPIPIPIHWVQDIANSPLWEGWSPVQDKYSAGSLYNSVTNVMSFYKLWRVILF